MFLITPPLLENAGWQLESLFITPSSVCKQAVDQIDAMCLRDSLVTKCTRSNKLVNNGVSSRVGWWVVITVTLTLITFNS